ncbi:MAG: hypothetical protein WC869_10550 [Phycisphaerae bacterium]|jgi:hypothetical protein
MATNEIPQYKKMAFWQMVTRASIPHFAELLAALTIFGLLGAYAKRVSSAYVFGVSYAAGIISAFGLLLLFYLVVESRRKVDDTLKMAGEIAAENNAVVTKKTRWFSDLWTAIRLSKKLFKGFLALLAAAAALALFMAIRSGYELFIGDMTTALASAFLFLAFAGSVGIGLVLIKWFVWEVSKIAGVMAGREREQETS